MVCVCVKLSRVLLVGHVDDKDFHRLQCIHGGQLAWVWSHPHIYTMFLQPERIVGEEYGLHSDIWSLGVTLFEVMLGNVGVCQFFCSYLKHYYNNILFAYRWQLESFHTLV